MSRYKSLLWLLALLMLWSAVSHGQQSSFPLNEWVKKLDDPEDLDQRAIEEVQQFIRTNPMQADIIFAALQKRGEEAKAGPFFRLRLGYLQMNNIVANDATKSRFSELKRYMDTLFVVAHKTGDDRAMAMANWFNGSFMYYYQQLEEAATYCLRALELFGKEKSFQQLNYYYCTVGEILFRTNDYHQSIQYTIKGIPALQAKPTIPHFFVSRFMNTAGQAYHRLGLTDSAMYYYEMSRSWAIAHDDAQWEAINACFIGQVQFARGKMQDAYTSIWQGYEGNKDKDPAMESCALLWLGKWYAFYNRRDSAAYYLHRSLAVKPRDDYNQRLQMADYRQLIYQELANLHRQSERPDSFYYYQDRFTALHDSLQHIALISSMKMVQLRNDALNNQLMVGRLRMENEQQRRNRNLIIAGILLAASLAIFELVRQRKMLKLQQEAERLRKQAAELEVAAAREQLEMFARALQEKTQLINKLQASDAGHHPDTDRLWQELTRQTILTEADWIGFRNNFEKIYPGFFTRIRQSVPDMTMAEQRMAALILLNMNVKEMSALLGISPDSVRKTRLRLRQRLQLGADDDLMQHLAQIAATAA